MIGQASIQHWGGQWLPVGLKGIAFINVHKSHIDYLVMQILCILCSIDRLSFSGDTVQKYVHADHKLKDHQQCGLIDLWFAENLTLTPLVPASASVSPIKSS